MKDSNAGEIRTTIRSRYAKTALGSGSGCCDSGCCGSKNAATAEEIALAVGYTKQELHGIPEGANMGLGCGNPQAIAALKPGEIVVDLGSGGGFDCFLAARQVGASGRVIGVDMTPEMIEKARRNADSVQCANVTFRLGEIEHLPVADGEADVLISNCVVNLSTDKAQVFREAQRVLKPGGRIAMSDIVALTDMPEEIRQDVLLHAECVAGAEHVDALERMLRDAGFRDISIRPNRESGRILEGMFPGLALKDVIASAVIEAVKG